MAKKRAKKKPASKRISTALTRWLKKQNPAMKRAASVKITKLRGGGITIRPNPSKPFDIYVWTEGHWQNVAAIYADSAAEALRLAKRGAWKRYKIKVKKA